MDCGKALDAAAPSPAPSPAPAAPPFAPGTPSARPPHHHRASPSIGRRASSAAPRLDLSLAPRGRVPAANMVTCGWCGGFVEAGLPFCPHCGRRTDATLAAVAACATCGSAIRPGLDTFCASCGTPLDEKAGRASEDGAKTLAFSAKRPGLRARIAVLDEHGEVKRTVPMDSSELTVGRGSCDLSFDDDRYISPIHAQFVFRDGALHVRDLGSCNRTWVFLDAPYMLADGDVLLIGSQILEFQRLDSPAAPGADADGTWRIGSLTPAPDIARLSQLRADGSVRNGQCLATGRALVIGRDGGDWIFPYDQTMSGRHAELREAGGEFVLHDLGSRNGIAVAVRGERALEIGQCVLLGDQVLRVESV